MVVLITNDDGYKTEGLHTLYRAAKKVFGFGILLAAVSCLPNLAAIGAIIDASAKK